MKSSPKRREVKNKMRIDFLCRWDFCKSCIDFRIKYNLPIPKLKGSKCFKPYFIPTKKPKRVKKYNGLSDFLRNSTNKEKKKVFTKAAREANLEQRRLLKDKK